MVGIKDIAATTVGTCVDCAAGKYVASTGNVAASDCTDCTAGRYALFTDVGATHLLCANRVTLGTPLMQAQPVRQVYRTINLFVTATQGMGVLVAILPLIAMLV